MTPALLRFPVTCPICGTERLSEFRVADLIDSFAKSRPLTLRVVCHDYSWAASPTEVDQAREYLRAVWLDHFTGVR
jgi:hypothetical protein